MLKRLTVAAAFLTLSACASNSAPPITLTPSPDLMIKPCTMAEPSTDSDDDLAADVANADCVRKLRLHVYRLQAFARLVTEKPR